MNKKLRILVGITTTCMVVAAANFYLNFGWFGNRAKLVLFFLAFIQMVSLLAAMRLWKEESPKP